MLCYVGKATKIFFFLVGALAVAGLFLGLGLHHGWASHKTRPRPNPLCPGGGGTGPCSPITSFPDPATAAAVPPPMFPDILPVGPTSASAAAPPPPPAAPTADVSASPPSLAFLSPPVPTSPAPTADVSAPPPSPVVTNPVVVAPPAAAVATAPPPVTAPPATPSDGLSPSQP